MDCWGLVGFHLGWLFVGGFGGEDGRRIRSSLKGAESMFTFTKKVRRPSVALVVSFVALFASFGGGAYAAFQLPNNSVGTRQLRNKAVTGAKLAPNSVGTADLKDGAVTAAKINTSGLTVPSDQTASNFAQGSPNQTITAATATIGSPVQITTTGTKRVFASAAVHAVNGVPGTGTYLVCHLTIDGTSGVNDTAYASPAGGFTIVDASVSPLASAVVGAGTHTVSLLCSAAGGGAPQARVVDDALGTWAVAK